MAFLELIDETLDINSTENYDLSLELSFNSLSFCILDSIRNKFILLRSYLPDSDRKYSISDLAEIINKDEFILKKFRKLSIISQAFKFTLVPAPLFEAERKEEYFLLNHYLDEDQSIQVNRLKEPDAFLIYSEKKSLNELIASKWPDQPFIHHLKPLLLNASLIANDHRDYLFIHAEKDFFNLVVYNRNTLKLCNSFAYRTYADIIYYTLNVIKHQGLDQESVTILSGQVKKKDELFLELTKYLKNVKYSEPKGSFDFSYVMNDTDLFRYINIITAVNCG
jgi:hypothetical protein